MATPFTAFRKYTGVMMAVLCVLLMISFVVADALPGWSRGSGGGGRGGDVVATWDGGSITERQLEDALVHRGILDSFQRGVIQLGFQSAQAAGVEDLPLRVIPLQLRLTREQGVEADVVRTKIFAQRAREAGMVVSDETVSDFLQALGRDRVSIDQMRTLISGMKMGGGRRATTAFLFELVREELLNRAYIDSHRYLFNTVLPSEQWDDWLKVNRRLVLEAAPLEVDDFIADVSEPSDAEVAAYYEEYKDRVARPDVIRDYGGIELPSPLPGFTTPERVRVEYVVAKFNDFVAKAEPEVTDEEIEKFYNDNREQFISADASLFGEDSLFGGSDTDDGGDTAEPGDAAGATEPADDTTAAEQDANDADTSESDTSESETQVDTETTEATEEEEEEEESEQEESAEASADDAASPSDGDEPSDEQATDPASDEESDVVYEPLEEVSDEIRTLIAQAKATELIEQRMEAVRREVNDEYNKHFDAVLDAEDAGQEPPAAPTTLTNLDGVAQKYGLERGSLAPASQLDLRETTAGKTLKLERSTQRAVPYYVLAFVEGGVDQYEPAVTFDQVERDRYLLVVTERLERNTPKLEEIRDKVVDAWKREKAAELALKRAEELATKAEQSGKSLSEYFADDDTIAPFQTEPVSFLTIGSVSRQTGQVALRMSQPDSLVAAGPDLMEKAFDLKPGEVVATLNHDRSIAYLLRIAQALGTPEELRSDFLRDGANWYGAASTRQARRTSAALALFDTLLGSANLEWEREPDL